MGFLKKFFVSTARKVRRVLGCKTRRDDPPAPVEVSPEDLTTSSPLLSNHSSPHSSPHSPDSSTPSPMPSSHSPMPSSHSPMPSSHSPMPSSHSPDISNQFSFTWLSSDELQKIPLITVIREGKYGLIYLAVYNKELAVMKMYIKENQECFLNEMAAHISLNGIAGAPRLYAACPEAYALLLEYTGIPLEDYFSCCTLRKKLEVLIKIAERLGELHKKNIIHNNLKPHSITLTFQGEEPIIHLIDYRVASETGCLEKGNSLRRCKNPGYWLAPEFGKGGVPSPTTDTYSFAHLVIDVKNQIFHPLLQECLRMVAGATCGLNPLHRAPLPEVIGLIRSFLPLSD
ncbi:Casein kinase I isoform gamma-1-like 1 [Homarus americanus]|uniref:Casein kinase I isoform gamma-1-like 1 n=1 Tax=Homarus americanus TaxID=6706 RepID=A0A8J5KFW2_HOMAM|nr:Casein kinase I isoform gamma-1-like 1 [Homarus americanus]